MVGKPKRFPGAWVAKDKLCRSKCDGELGFRDMNAFNTTLLAKQVCHKMHKQDLLVSHVLKDIHFLEADMLDAQIVEELVGSRWVVDKGSWWMMGSGYSLSVWDFKWVLKPCSFKFITRSKPKLPYFE